jgi:hypothetical protein
LSDSLKNDYSLSIEELFKKSDTHGSIADKLAQTSMDLAKKDLGKAIYYAFLATLKDMYTHPYDSIIYSAETLALNDKLTKANNLLRHALLEYIRKGQTLREQQ